MSRNNDRYSIENASSKTNRRLANPMSSFFVVCHSFFISSPVYLFRGRFDLSNGLLIKTDNNLYYRFYNLNVYLSFKIKVFILFFTFQ